MTNELKPCPICGAKAFVHHDIVDGFGFGWSVGCPRACIEDGIHGFDDYDSFHNAKLVMFNFTTKQEAIDTWNKRAEMESSDADSDFSDYPDQPYQFDNMTGAMNL